MAFHSGALNRPNLSNNAVLRYVYVTWHSSFHPESQIRKHKGSLKLEMDRAPFDATEKAGVSIETTRTIKNTSYV
jgi:hypothetical protein